MRMEWFEIVDGETADEVCARIGARMAALHPLEDHVVAGLQGQVQVGHEPGLLGQAAHQGRVRAARPKSFAIDKDMLLVI